MVPSHVCFSTAERGGSLARPPGPRTGLPQHASLGPAGPIGGEGSPPPGPRSGASGSPGRPRPSSPDQLRALLLNSRRLPPASVRSPRHPSHPRALPAAWEEHQAASGLRRPRGMSCRTLSVALEYGGGKSGGDNRCGGGDSPSESGGGDSQNSSSGDGPSGHGGGPGSAAAMAILVTIVVRGTLSPTKAQGQDGLQVLRDWSAPGPALCPPPPAGWLPPVPRPPDPRPPAQTHDVSSCPHGTCGPPPPGLGPDSSWCCVGTRGLSVGHCQP